MEMFRRAINGLSDGKYHILWHGSVRCRNSLPHFSSLNLQAYFVQLDDRKSERPIASCDSACHESCNDRRYTSQMCRTITSVISNGGFTKGKLNSVETAADTAATATAPPDPHKQTLRGCRELSTIPVARIILQRGMQNQTPGILWADYSQSHLQSENSARG